MGQSTKNEVKSEVQANTMMTNSMVDGTVIFITSTPIGQYIFQKIEKLLLVSEQTSGWLQSVKGKENCNGNVKEHKHQNGHANSSEVPLPYDTRPFSWILFFPLLVCFVLCHFYVNIIRFIVNKPPVKSDDIKQSVQKLRHYLINARLQGSKNIRNKQKMSAERLKQNPPQLNIICRTFSKWPLKLFVRRLRKTLNFLGVITLPLPSDLKQTSILNHNNEKEPAKKNGISNMKEPSHHSDKTDFTDSQGTYESEEFYEEAQVKREAPTRRVSVTVQEVIFEENEEESFTSMKDQLNNMDQDFPETFTASQDCHKLANNITLNGTVEIIG